LSGKFHGGSVNFKVGVEGGDYTGAIVHVYYSSEYHQFGGYLVGVTDDMAANGWSEGDLFWAIDSAPTYSVTLQLGHSAPHCGKCVVRIGTRYSSDIPQYIPPQSFATFMNFTIETRKDSTLLELEPISDATVCNGPETWLKVSPR